MPVMLAVLGGAGDLALKKLVDQLDRLLARHGEIEVRLADVVPADELARRWVTCRGTPLPDAWSERYRAVERAPGSQWLEAELSAVGAGHGVEWEDWHVIVYLALAPRLYLSSMLAYAALGATGCKLTFAIEKPLALSHDDLNQLCASVRAFDENVRVFAVDHYLGKWAVLFASEKREDKVIGRLLTRFNRATLQALESGGVPRDRLPFYSEVGCFSDVFPHLASCLVALSEHLVGDRHDGGLVWNGHLGRVRDLDLSRETYFCLQFDDHHGDDGAPCRVALRSGKSTGKDLTQIRFEVDGDGSAPRSADAGGLTPEAALSVLECHLRTPPAVTLKLPGFSLSSATPESPNVDDPYLVVFERLLAGTPLGLSFAEQERVVRRMLDIAGSAAFIHKQSNPVLYAPGDAPPCACVASSGAGVQSGDGVG